MCIVSNVAHSCLSTGFVTRLTRRVTTSGAGTAHPSGAPEFTTGFLWGSCYSIFSFICMFCRSLFVLLYFFVWPLCCLFFFDIRILITPLVSSNYSCQWLWIDHAWLYLRVSLTFMLRVSLTFIVVNLYRSSPNHHSHVNASIPTWYCHPNHHSHVDASIPTWYCHSWFLRSLGKDQNVINSERIPMAMCRNWYKTLISLWTDKWKVEYHFLSKNVSSCFCMFHLVIIFIFPVSPIV